MNKEFINLLRQSRREGMGFFCKRDREKYLGYLDVLIKDPPRFSEYEVKIISQYINRSIGFYLHLTGICAGMEKIRIRYDGCMENLIMLLDFIMYGYSNFISKEYMEKLYAKAINQIRFCPFSKKKLIEYEIDTGLVEKIYFYLEYYFSK